MDHQSEKGTSLLPFLFSSQHSVFYRVDDTYKPIVLGVGVKFKVLVNKSLNRRDLQREYPRKMPFYLYGTPKSPHIDHILLRAPNAVLSATAVELQLDVPLTHIIPAKGLQLPLIAIFDDVYEATMQPFGESNEPTVFTPGKTFNVSIYGGTNVDSTATVLDESLGPLLATGTLNIGQRVWREFISLNMELLPPKPHANIHTSVPFQLRGEKELMDALRSVSDHEHRAKFVCVSDDEDKAGVLDEDKATIEKFYSLLRSRKLSKREGEE